jgi:predicted alpha/beta hydrolase
MARAVRYRLLHAASWLAGQGFLTATFDYRGIGRSRNGRLRDVDATVVDWAVVDCAAMVDAVAARAPGNPITHPRPAPAPRPLPRH